MSFGLAGVSLEKTQPQRRSQTASFLTGDMLTTLKRQHVASAAWDEDSIVECELIPCVLPTSTLLVLDAVINSCIGMMENTTD